MDFNKFTLFFRYGRDYGRAMVKDIGVNDTEYTICSFLNFYPNAPQDMLSKSYMLDKTTVTKALHSLEERGLITKQVNPENRRQKLLNLTAEGKDLIKDSLNIYDDWVEKVSSVLTDSEQKQFEKILDKLLKEAASLKDEAEQN